VAIINYLPIHIQIVPLLVDNPQLFLPNKPHTIIQINQPLVNLLKPALKLLHVTRLLLGPLLPGNQANPLQPEPEPRLILHQCIHLPLQCLYPSCVPLLAVVVVYLSG